MISGASDWQRRAVGLVMEAILNAPDQTRCSSAPLFPGCDLLSYGGSGPVVLIVPAPIKRHYIWDLLPGASAVRSLLDHGFSVHLLNWTDTVIGLGGGLEFFAAEAPGRALQRLSVITQGRPVFLAGHSLGGLFAAAAACLHPHLVAGLLLIETPLAFSRHRFCVASKMAAPLFPMAVELTGTELTVLSVALLPDEFLWRRWQDAVQCLGNGSRMRRHLAVLRWAFDEFPMPVRLLKQLLTLMAADSFLDGNLAINGKCIGPSDLVAPVLAIVAGSEVAPPTAVEPFLECCSDARIWKFPAEPGTALPHVSPLVGPAAQRRLWPQIAAWMATAA